MEYKRLGDYISEVNVRNENASITNLLGVNLSKKFIPSVANIIGTDLSNYKVIQKGQFGCKLMSIGRDGILPISFKRDNEPAIISSAYYVFEVNDEKELSSEYLMLCFLRPEFDRQLAFYSGGDVRGGVSFDDFCNMPIPFPDIDEQRRIVAEYQTIENRIENNNRLIQKLEDTAKAIYHHAFVENIDPDNLPDGWRMGEVRDFGSVVTGKTPSTSEEENFGGNIPFVTIPDMHDYPFAYITERTLSKKGADSQKKKYIPANTVCVSCIGTSGLVTITVKECQTNQQINSIIPFNRNNLYYIYLTMSNLKRIIAEYGLGGAVLNNLSKGEFEKLTVIIPPEKNLQSFNNKVANIFEYIKYLMQENILMTDAKSILISKLA